MAIWRERRPPLEGEPAAGEGVEAGEGEGVPGPFLDEGGGGAGEIGVEGGEAGALEGEGVGLEVGGASKGERWVAVVQV